MASGVHDGRSISKDTYLPCAFDKSGTLRYNWISSTKMIEEVCFLFFCLFDLSFDCEDVDVDAFFLLHNAFFYVLRFDFKYLRLMMGLQSKISIFKL